jgi:DNA ligase (NAD+)
MGKGMVGKKRAQKIVDSLEQSRKVEFPDFLGSLGIRGVGRSLCRVLCSKLNITTCNEAIKLTTDQIEPLDGFGPVRAMNFCYWIEEHMDEVVELGHMMSFQDVTDEKFSLFSGQTVCFTGKSPKSRKEMAALAESVGATVSNSVNHNTTILVLADLDSTSSKAMKAHDMGIILMSPEDFLTQVEESK